MLLEPEEFVERRVVEWLAQRGYRVVPVRSSEEGLDLVQRMRFDVVFCSTELHGLNWVEFFDRVRGRVGAFALLAEAFSQDLSTHFRGEGRYVLHKPIEQSQFDRTLEAIESGPQADSPMSLTLHLLIIGSLWCLVALVSGEGGAMAPDGSGVGFSVGTIR